MFAAEIEEPYTKILSAILNILIFTTAENLAKWHALNIPVRAVPTSRSFVFHLTTWVTWPTLSVWFWTWPWDPLLSKNRKLAKLNITSKNKQRFSVLIIFIATLIGSHPTHCSYLHQYIYTLQAAVPDKELNAITSCFCRLKRRNVLRSPLTLCCHMQFPVQIMNSLYI